MQSAPGAGLRVGYDAGARGTSFLGGGSLVPAGIAHSGSLMCKLYRWGVARDKVVCSPYLEVVTCTCRANQTKQNKSSVAFVGIAI